MAAAVRPTIMGPGDDDEEDLVPEVTREHVARERKAAAAKARAAERETKTRRSWYTSVKAADAFQAAVDDIHHTTRVPKHLVVAALLEAAAAQADKVQKQLVLKLAHDSHR
jgi:hypothetical protein